MAGFRMNVEEVFFTDERFPAIAHDAGEDEDLVRMRCMRIWRFAVLQRTDRLTPGEINRQGRWRRKDVSFSELLVRHELADPIGEDGKHRCRGVSARLQLYEQNRKAANARWNSMKGKTPPDESCECNADAMRPHSECNADAMQTIYIEDKVYKRGCGGDDPPPPPSEDTPTPQATKTHRYKFEAFDMELARAWSEHAVSVSTSVKTDLEAWANEFRKMREIDGLDPETLRSMLNFVRADDFWGANAVSPMALRHKSRNGLIKHENIVKAMASRKTAKPKASSRWEGMCTHDEDKSA